MLKTHLSDVSACWLLLQLVTMAVLLPPTRSMLQVASAGVAAADASRPQLPLPLDRRRRTPPWLIVPLLIPDRIRFPRPRQRRSQRNRTLSAGGTFSLAHAIPLWRGRRLSPSHSVGLPLHLGVVLGFRSAFSGSLQTMFVQNVVIKGEFRVTSLKFQFNFNILRFISE